MALGNSTNKIYLSVADGKVVRKVAEGVSGAEPYTKKDGSIIWQQRFAFISGYLKSISTKTNSFNGSEMKDWVFEIEDNGEYYTLQINYDSRYAVSLLNAMCNPVVDFSKPITISPWMKVVNDKKKTACYLKQGSANESIEWFFTKDVPNGLPPLELVNFKGKESWDNFKQMQFLEKYVEDKIKPQLNSNHTHIAVDPEPEFVGDDMPEDDGSDLPF